MATHHGRTLAAVMILTAGLLGSGCKVHSVASESTSLSMLKAHGNEAFAQGDYASAAQHYGEFVERRPQNAEARYDLGRALLGLGQASAAREHLAIAHDLRPDDPRYTDYLARAIYLSDSPEALMAFLQREAAADGTSIGYMRLGRFAAEIGLVDEAERALLHAAELDSGRSSRPYKELADFYRGIGDHGREVEMLRVVLHFEPGNMQAMDRVRELGEIPGPSFSHAPGSID